MKDEDLRLIGTSDGEETAFTSTIWEDEEEQRFYEYLTDMKEFLPSITLRPPEPVSEVTESKCHLPPCGLFSSELAN
jgi:hypothetical protein